MRTHPENTCWPFHGAIRPTTPAAKGRAVSRADRLVLRRPHHRIDDSAARSADRRERVQHAARRRDHGGLRIERRGTPEEPDCCRGEVIVRHSIVDVPDERDAGEPRSRCSVHEGLEAVRMDKTRAKPAKPTSEAKRVGGCHDGRLRRQSPEPALAPSAARGPTRRTGALRWSPRPFQAGQRGARPQQG